MWLCGKNMLLIFLIFALFAQINTQSYTACPYNTSTPMANMKIKTSPGFIIPIR